MFFKKLLVTATIAIMVPVLAACGNTDQNAKDNKTQVSEESKQNASTKGADPKEWTLEKVGEMLEGSKKLKADIEAGNYEKAKDTWLEAHSAYESAEAMVATISGELDETIDVSSEIGFHGIEGQLWAKNPDQKKMLSVIDQLITDIGTLQSEVEKTEFTDQLLFTGVTGVLTELGAFVEEVYSGDSVSGTRIHDARNVFEGVDVFYGSLKERIAAKDEALVKDIDSQIENSRTVLFAEKPDVEAVDEENGKLFQLLVQAAEKLGVTLE